MDEEEEDSVDVQDELTANGNRRSLTLTGVHDDEDDELMWTSITDEARMKQH